MGKIRTHRKAEPTSWILQGSLSGFEYFARVTCTRNLISLWMHKRRKIEEDCLPILDSSLGHGASSSSSLTEEVMMAGLRSENRSIKLEDVRADGFCAASAFCPRHDKIEKHEVDCNYYLPLGGGARTRDTNYSECIGVQ